MIDFRKMTDDAGREMINNSKTVYHFVVFRRLEKNDKEGTTMLVMGSTDGIMNSDKITKAIKKIDKTIIELKIVVLIATNNLKMAQNLAQHYIEFQQEWKNKNKGNENVEKFKESLSMLPFVKCNNILN